MLPAPTPGTPSIRAVWMPWKWIVCGWLAALMNRIRRRSPSRARSVGPGTRPLYAHAAYFTPGATSISFSSATSSHSRTPPRTTPSSKSRRIACGSKPFADGSTLPIAPTWAAGSPCPLCGSAAIAFAAGSAPATSGIRQRKFRRDNIRFRPA